MGNGLVRQCTRVYYQQDQFILNISQSATRPVFIGYRVYTSEWGSLSYFETDFNIIVEYETPLPICLRHHTRIAKHQPFSLTEVFNIDLIIRLAINDWGQPS